MGLGRRMGSAGTATANNVEGGNPYGAPGRQIVLRALLACFFKRPCRPVKPIPWNIKIQAVISGEKPIDRQLVVFFAGDCLGQFFTQRPYGGAIITGKFLPVLLVFCVAGSQGNFAFAGVDGFNNYRD